MNAHTGPVSEWEYMYASACDNAVLRLLLAAGWETCGVLEGAMPKIELRRHVRPGS